jgi:hypothetical protein
MNPNWLILYGWVVKPLKSTEFLLNELSDEAVSNDFEINSKWQSMWFCRFFFGWLWSWWSCRRPRPSSRSCHCSSLSTFNSLTHASFFSEFIHQSPASMSLLYQPFSSRNKTQLNSLWWCKRQAYQRRSLAMSVGWECQVLASDVLFCASLVHGVL